jgi:large subunit ribosomal protein L27e
MQYYHFPFPLCLLYIGIHSIKSGKCVIILAGRYAGHKAVVTKVLENGTKDRPFGHAVVVGVARYPRKIVKSLSQKQLAKRVRVKPFIQAINFSHILPTRYVLWSLIAP